METTEKIRSDVEDFRQRGLERLARHEGFTEDELILLGRILSLENHHDVRSVNPSSAYNGASNLMSYEVILEGIISEKRVERIFDDLEFPEPTNKRYSKKAASYGFRVSEDASCNFVLRMESGY